jgi:hypothetical protein
MKAEAVGLQRTPEMNDDGVTDILHVYMLKRAKQVNKLINNPHCT